jgi:hypothetical protein
MSESDGTRGEWVVAATCTWLHEAQFLKSVLESVGIIATIPDEHTLGVQPLYSNLLGGARILVQAADLSQAQEVLESSAIEPTVSDPDDAV